MINRPTLRTLLDHPRLLAETERCASFDQPATITRLRKIADASLVREAIELITARRRAAGKLPAAERLMLDTVGVQQASSSAVAAVKAQRFAEAGVNDIIDLCCGIGGDAMALARDAQVTLIDRDPCKTWMARCNVEQATGRRCAAACADVTRLNLRDRVFHLDPARRNAAGRRRHAYEDYQPGPSFIDDLLVRCPTGAIKLGPGVEVDLLPPGEVQFISERGTLVQAVLWTGALAGPDARTATVIATSGDATTLGGSVTDVPCGPIARYLLAVDPAAERAGLMGALCEQLNVVAVHPKLGLLTSDQPIDSPFVTDFEHLATMPVRQVPAWLREHDGGIAEIKTRGKAADPDALQSQWRGSGSSPYTIFVLRHDTQIRAHITRRL